MEQVHTEKKIQEGKTFYRLTGPSWELVQAASEKIMESSLPAHSHFTLPRKVVGQFMAHGIVEAA